MENKVIEFSINNQQLKRIDNNIIVNKLKNYLIAKFNFEDGWDGLDTYVIFKDECNSYCLPLYLEDNVAECVVPYEVLGDRLFKLTVFGGDLLTTNELTIYLLESGYTTDLTSTSEPSQDVFSEINNKLYNKSNIGHKHEINEINGLTDELDELHGELMNEVNSIHEELNNKSDINHTHENELNVELDEIHEELNNKSNINHTHNATDIVDLEDSMDIDIKKALNSLVSSIRTYGE